MLEFKQSDYEEIRRHGEETYPDECCGVLLGTMNEEGDHRIVSSTVRCHNTREDRPQDRFYIDPRDLVRIQRQGREQGLDIVGFYHSHPDCPAQWSKTDFAEAHWIGCSYVITRVDKARAVDTNSFWLRGTEEEDKHFEDEPITFVAVAQKSDVPLSAQASMPPAEVPGSDK
ncbi:MAG TPA: M67 family metallopeptidase [Terriglobales bacterium]|nr:M67 family metallopeptidase [Terriglobales bacterium]